MNGSQSPYGGVPDGQEGLILQRGGEELLLTKRLDRFLVRFSDRSLLPEQVPAVATWGQVTAIDGTPLYTIHCTDGVALDEVMAEARQCPQVLYASHIYGVVGDPETEVYIGDEVTIAFERTVNRARIQTLTTGVGLALGSSVRGLDNTWITQLTPLARENPIKLANRLMMLPEVLLAEANVMLRKASFYAPKDSLYRHQWYLSKTQAQTQTAEAIVDIDVERAWDITRGERTIVIAVADEGIDLNHPDFQGMGKLVAPRDLRSQDFLPLPEAPQENHGTAVAGVALAEENGSGIVGVAPGCALLPIRTTGYLDDRSIEEIFHWAVDQGAAVICCSWGAGSVHFPLSLRQQAALSYAARSGRGGKGCVIIFAAGNFNRPVNASIPEQGWPRNLLSGTTHWLNGFAAHPDTIAVSACTSQGQKAAYSNWGNEIFIAAPSSNGIPAIVLTETGLIPTAPEIKTPLVGLGVWSSDRTGTAGYDPGDFTATFGGTSSAAPVVAGVVGLMLSVNPALTLAEVKDILRQTADKRVDSDPDPQLGLRLGSYERNGHSPWFGYGMINAYKAVQAALDRKPKLTLSSAKPPETLTLAFNPEKPLPIPDNDRLVQTLTVMPSRLVLGIEISVELEHDFLGDVEIGIQTPRGDGVLLQPRTLGRQTRLETTYSLRTTPGLERLLKTNAQGDWQLQISDRAPGCSGILKHWGLELTLG
jgi:subtilisin family serine protease/subtilisin-like proprotein convertase family protein